MDRCLLCRNPRRLHNDRLGQPATVTPEERILIRAARLRVTCDRKLGHTTPTWVIELAQRELEPLVK